MKTEISDLKNVEKIIPGDIIALEEEVHKCDASLKNLESQLETKRSTVEEARLAVKHTAEVN